jgi:hypothetical protein
MANFLAEYVLKPSSRAPRAQVKERRNISLLEKIWVGLMVLSLTVAAINVAAGEGPDADNQKTATPLKQVLIELVMK